MSFECPKCHAVSHHPEDERHGYCGNCHEFTGHLVDKPTGINLIVSGIVAARNGIPYVQIATDQRMVAQLTVQEARNVAHDILGAAHNAEADAMIVRFFRRNDFPDTALGALMTDFRQFRHELEMEKVETSRLDPDTGEKA